MSSALCRVGHRVLQRLELVMQVADAPAAGDRFVEDRAAGHFLDVLAEVADGRASSAPRRRPRRRILRPTIIRKRVVLPAPFGPTSPTFSPGLSWNEASTKRICRPYCLLMRERAIIRPSVPRGAGKPSGAVLAKRPRAQRMPEGEPRAAAFAASPRAKPFRVPATECVAVPAWYSDQSPVAGV